MIHGKYSTFDVWFLLSSLFCTLPLGTLVPYCYAVLYLIFNGTLYTSSYPGSTLIVSGMIEQRRGKGEWAIVGGTGEFTLAQGAIYYDVLMDDGITSLIKELHIGLFYTRMERSKVSKVGNCCET